MYRKRQSKFSVVSCKLSFDFCQFPFEKRPVFSLLLNQQLIIMILIIGETINNHLTIFVYQHLVILTLIYMGGGDLPQAVFCYTSKTVGARLLKLCDCYC